MSNLTHKYLTINNFSEILLKWDFNQNSRTMPWKGEKDPYKIWLSEIILQQTRVEQGLEYYNRFVAHFPTIRDLALADEKKVFKLWEGLGYYLRCRNLIATARYIHAELKGVFPNTYEDILKLKGVGLYTASAIGSFAFNLPHAVVDGNVLRVLARVFGIKDAIDSTAGKNKFSKLAYDLLDRNKPALYNQAIMDFGATVCKPAIPLCTACVFSKYCVAYNENKVAALPVKEKKIKQRKRFFYFFLIQYHDKIALRERTQKDIWQHLHEFPLIESKNSDEITNAITEAQKKGWLSQSDKIDISDSVYKQKLTHQTIYARFIRVKVYKASNALEAYEWISIKSVSGISFPKIINEFLNKEIIKKE